jgi:uncharacterized protein YhaN
MDDASILLSALTDGRYTRVTLSPYDLEPRVDTLDRSGIPGSQLSRAVQDQLYLTLRVALARGLARGKRLPLVLDDPYANLDPDRSEGTITLMRSLALRMQVILFTCNPRYEEWFEPVLRLGRTDASQGAERRAIS